MNNREITKNKFIEIRNTRYTKHNCNWIVGFHFELYDEQQRQKFLEKNLGKSNA